MLGTLNDLDRIQTLFAEEAAYLGTLRPREAPPALDVAGIERALKTSLWRDNSSVTAFNVAAPGESVCFVVSDHTRRTAAHLILPPIIAALRERGCRLSDMSILIASGIHRSPTAGELSRILGQTLCEEFTDRLFAHDADDATELVDVGTTRAGHRVRLNRRAVQCRRLVLLGAATYHYHAGFGGGRKSLVPGLASRDTIAYTHSLTLDPHLDRTHPMAAPGVLDGNPVSSAMYEAASLRIPDLIVTSVLSARGELVGLYTGDMDLAHRRACRDVQQIGRVDVDPPADFVVATTEAADWIQSHKALYNASRAVKPTGRIVLVAPCPEGLGNDRFRRWVGLREIEAVYAELRKSAEILGQTALSTLTRGKRTVLVTDMEEKDRNDLGIQTAPDLESAVRTVILELRHDGIGKPTYYLMPSARHTVPFTAQ